ncbi:hypothetical protein [Pontivivens nitratireducens]|uniref:Uncharacterized protein n=1 Tax=Pontivivens nitratireducens TaxID=2758038 RepID=A0A6G7VM40_9RHOB|nr:hypothetical protein [Pontibrevibacter nitratireducens]QIK41109.1 hypothetical protein G8E03_10205 [Pontibrevibacter nitratireducens]
MRSTLNARSAIIAEEPKGALFLLRRYGHQAIFGIKLSEPLEQPNSKPTVLLLNPDFGRAGEADWHRVFQWEADEWCVSFGTDWIIQPDFATSALSEINDPQPGACLTIGPPGIHFRAAPGEGFRASYRHFIHVDTLDLVKDLGNSSFHLTGYRIFLNREDWDNGRAPIYQHGV